MTKGQTNHNWFVLESVKLRLQKSLSDLNGMDPLIHGGTVTGIFRELCNALVKHRNKPEVSPMRKIYRSIKKASPLILERTGAKSPYGARAFRELVVLATEYAERTIPRD